MVVVVVVVVTKASDYRTFLLTKLRRKASAKKARNGPSTDVIDYTSFVKIAIDSKKAEELP